MYFTYNYGRVCYLCHMCSMTFFKPVLVLGSLSVFETRTATGSELFSLLTCFHSTTFTLLSIFSPLEMISTKTWETPLSWHAKCSLPVAVRISKTPVLKFSNVSWGSHTSSKNHSQNGWEGLRDNLKYR